MVSQTTMKDNPEVKANFFNRICFFYTFELFKTGYRRNLTTEDIYATRKDQFSDALGDALEKSWDLELKRSREDGVEPSLTRALVRVFWFRYMLWGIAVAVMYLILWPALPYSLALFISYFSSERTADSYKWAHVNCFILNLVTFLQIFVYNHVTLGQSVVGMQARTACCSLMYRKLLKLSNKSLHNTAPGQVINLMSNDVIRFDQVAYGLNYIALTPPYVVVISYLIWQSIHLSTIAVLLVMALQSFGIQGYLNHKLGGYRANVAKRTDERVKVMSELVNGVQVVKMYAWEIPFEKLVHTLRKYEIKMISKATMIKGFSSAFSVFTERFILFTGIGTFILLGGKLSSEITFSLLQYFNLLQMGCSIHLAIALGFLSEARVSVKRIENFLALEELPQVNPVEKPKREREDKNIIQFKNVTATWLEDQIVNTLRNINLNIGQGELIGIAGPVGCGKSTLLQAIIGELPLKEGTVTLNGATVSYASQAPWLFVDTVRENILFGETYDKIKYDKVVLACALSRDFKQFPFKDMSLVGERGVSLSGGQRARIGLARAVYREADIYLLDDPLSAVDSKVGKHIMSECVMGYLKDKTRLLVTHQLYHLKNADSVVVMRDGEIEMEGSFEVVSTNQHFSQLLKSEKGENQEETAEEGIRKRTSSKTSHVSVQLEGREDDESEHEQDELMEKGRISKKVYAKYFTTGNGWVILTVFVASMIVGQAITSGSDMWLTYWMDSIEHYQTQPYLQELENDTQEITVEPHTNESSSYYVIVWFILILGCVLFTAGRSLMLVWVCMRSCIKMHNKMFSNVLKAPMRFFDTNPSGRILNRFSKDMGTADELLPRMIIEAMQIFLVLAGILVNVAIMNPYMLWTTIICAIAMYYMTILYLKTAQAVKRIEGVNRSPVFSHVTSSMDGLGTIRSFSAQTMLRKQFDSKQDVHTAAWYLTLVSNTAFGVWLSMVTFFYLIVVSYSFLLYERVQTTSGNVGLSISCSLSMVNMIQYGIRMTTDTMAQMTSVERILQFTKLPQEYPLESLAGKKPNKEWPSEGKIEFKDVYLRYEEGGEPVLKDLNFTIKEGWKVGVVGRTGAGKSSIIAALFQLANIDGAIIIDGVDTSEIGLRDLRSKLAIIPQEPVLFTASLRYNLDPFDRHSDAEIWTALEQVELKSSIASLSTEVKSGGSNFSAGQRQLICLARAILSHNRVLIMDEATANVDPQTDTLIQRTIRSYFKACTVITVAHRLHTIADSDRVLVMEGGQMVQWGPPHELLQDRSGAFATMVRQLGDAAESSVRDIAKNVYLSNKNID